MEYFAILPVFSEFQPSVKVRETGYFVNSSVKLNYCSTPMP